MPGSRGAVGLVRARRPRRPNSRLRASRIVRNASGAGSNVDHNRPFAWVSFLTGAGFVLEAHYHRSGEWIDPIAAAVITGLGRLYLVRVRHLLRRAKRVKAAENQSLFTHPADDACHVHSSSLRCLRGRLVCPSP